MLNTLKYNENIIDQNASKHAHFLSDDLGKRRAMIKEVKEKIFLLVDDDLCAWCETKMKLRRTFALLTEDDLYLLEGREDELISRILLKAGNTQHQLKKLIAIL